MGVYFTIGSRVLRLLHCIHLWTVFPGSGSPPGFQCNQFTAGRETKDTPKWQWDRFSIVLASWASAWPWQVVWCNRLFTTSTAVTEQSSLIGSKVSGIRFLARGLTS